MRLINYLFFQHLLEAPGYSQFRWRKVPWSSP